MIPAEKNERKERTQEEYLEISRALRAAYPDFWSRWGYIHTHGSKMPEEEARNEVRVIDATWVVYLRKSNISRDGRDELTIIRKIREISVEEYKNSESNL
jgi:hypothetical protein